jgi:LacI family transcriptional regulator
MSHATLASRFKAVMGRTIHAEIERVRLNRAKDLITGTSLPLKQIAVQAGFKYVQYMTKLFRQRLGQTPAEFRNRGCR